MTKQDKNTTLQDLLIRDLENWLGFFRRLREALSFEETVQEREAIIHLLGEGRTQEAQEIILAALSREYGND
jgi:hypothetical protein